MTEELKDTERGNETKTGDSTGSEGTNAGEVTFSTEQ